MDRFDKAVKEIRELHEADERQLQERKGNAKELALACLGKQCKVLWKEEYGDLQGISGRIVAFDNMFVSVAESPGVISQIYLGYIEDIIPIDFQSGIE